MTNIQTMNTSNQTYDREELKSLLREHSLKFGNFTLASGQTASYYLDCRRITLHPRAC